MTKVEEFAGKADGGGVKFDGDKIPYHLLPVESLEEIAKVLGHGTKKYAAHNWRRGMSYHRLYRAAIGHIFKWWIGVDKDDESGLPHLAHAGCCILFLLSYESQKAKYESLDDRVKLEVK